MNRTQSHAGASSTLGRTAVLVRDPYQLERILGFVLWVGFFLVLFGLGE